MAESCSQVDSDVSSSSNPLQNGKRGAEEVVEPRVEGNKKHKIVEENNSGIESVMEAEESVKAEHPPSLKLAAIAQDAKKASSSNETGHENEDDNTSKENLKHLETPKKSVELPRAINSAATTQDEAERASISNEYEEEDTDYQEDHQRLDTTDRSPLKLNHDLATEREEHHPTDDTGSKNLYLGNLSFSVEEDDVRDFFKNVGEIADLRFAIKDDRFLGYGHIEFTTAEAAREALKLNNEMLYNRRVYIHYSRQHQVKMDFPRQQRGAYTPVSSFEKSKQRGDHAKWKTVYVRGFEYSDGFDNIKSALVEHFGKCGEISRLHVPKHYLTGDIRGVAFIEFKDSNGFNKALGLDGSEVGGSRLTVEEARKPRGDDREGSGYGSGGWSGSGAGWSSSGFGWSGSGGGWSASVVGRSTTGVGRIDSVLGRGGSSGGRSGYVLGRDGSDSSRSGSGGSRSGPVLGRGGSDFSRSGSGGGQSGPVLGRGGSGGGRGGSDSSRSGSGGGRSGPVLGRGGSDFSRSGSVGGWSGPVLGQGGSDIGRSGSVYGRNGSVYGRSGSGPGRGGSGGGWTVSGGNRAKESGSGFGWRRESGYGSRSNTESWSGSRLNAESWSGSRSNKESWSGNRSNTESWSGNRWHGESVSSYDGRWSREKESNDGRFSVGSGSGSSANGYSSRSHRGGGFFHGRSYDSRRTSRP